jgi:predicted MPP superfamily phosphohydrolase
MKKIIIVMFLIVLLLFSYAHFYERFNIQVKYVRIDSKKFASTYQSGRIVQISDVHISTLGDYERKVAQEVNELQPELILITGDFFQHKDLFERPDSEEIQKNIQEVSAFLKLLKSEQGIYVCRGNNDFSNDKEVSDLFLVAMQDIGVTVLSNAMESVNLNGENIHLIGVDYPEFYKLEVADFFIGEYEDGRCMQVNDSERNSYSHYLLRGDRTKWRDYSFSGKFRQTQPEAGGIGVTFYSQFDTGYDRFYRLRRSGSDETFVLSPHGAEPPIGDVYAATKMKANTWYQFRIECRTVKESAHMRARVWSADEPEPANWQAIAVDSSATFSDGTVGLWSHGKGKHQFDYLLVVNALGDTLMSQDFEDGELFKDAFGWVDFNYEHESISWLMQFVPENEFSLLLAHTPDKIEWAAPAGVDLQLSGHNHGGQIRIPFFGAPIVRSALGRKYAQGLFDFGETQLYVNRGIGTVLLPLRFFCRPEITVFDFKGSSF